MKPYQSVDGDVMLGVRIYDIDPDTVIIAGQVVVLKAGKVEAASEAQTGAILGVAAETHPGRNDAIDPRANGNEILVYDSPNMIMRCKAPTMAATGGSATTFVCTSMAAFADNDFKGGYIRLVEKGEESTNEDAIGQIREITASAGTSKTLTVESGGAICAGDVYEIYPPLGFAKGNLDKEKAGLSLAATAALVLKVVINRRNGFIGLMAASHALTN